MREDETTFGIEELAQICNVPARLLKNPPDWNDRSDPAMKMFHEHLERQNRRAKVYVNRIKAALKSKPTRAHWYDVSKRARQPRIPQPEKLPSVEDILGGVLNDPNPRGGTWIVSYDTFLALGGDPKVIEALEKERLEEYDETEDD